MRRLGVTAGLGVVLGCTSSSTFICSGDGDCLDGRCETNGYCSFPSDDCPGGWVYGEFSAPMLSGRCVGAEPSTQTEGSTTTPAPSSDTEPGTTTLPDPSADVSGDAPPTDSGWSTDTGEAMDTGQTTAGGPGFELCSAYSILFGKCIDQNAARAILVDCVESYYGYVYNADDYCIDAFIDVLACLSSLDCAELEAGKSSCDAELTLFNMACATSP